MVLKSIRSIVWIAAFISVWLPGRTAGAAEQSPEQVRLSLFEGSPGPSVSCTLEVVVNASAGEAILSCQRNTSPASHLGAHRALKPSEAARLHALGATRAPARSEGAGRPATASTDGARSTLTIQHGDQRVVLDLGPGHSTLSAGDQQILQMLRQLGDELRGSGRR
jgi:hypothetical protein